MKIWDLTLDKRCTCSVAVAACIGYFDGLHLGHQELINKTIKLSEELQCESAIITFNPDPWVTIKKVQNVKHITTMKQRQDIAFKKGIKNFFILDFNATMAAMSPDDFINFILDNIHLKGLVCGFDFHYGAKGIGDIYSLQSFAKKRFEFIFVQSINDDLGKISSSRICDYIQEGQVKEASQLLGYPFYLDAKVIHGKAQGKDKLGFPTANCEVNPEIILPKRGAYVGKVLVEGTSHLAMINIGHNPTFNQRHMISVEAHVLDFNGDIYGKEISVYFIDFIRDEIKFESIEALIKQLHNDVEYTRNYFIQ